MDPLKSSRPYIGTDIDARISHRLPILVAALPAEGFFRASRPTLINVSA